MFGRSLGYVVGRIRNLFGIKVIYRYGFIGMRARVKCALAIESVQNAISEPDLPEAYVSRSLRAL